MWFSHRFVDKRVNVFPHKRLSTEAVYSHSKPTYVTSEAGRTWGTPDTMWDKVAAKRFSVPKCLIRWIEQRDLHSFILNREND